MLTTPTPNSLQSAEAEFWQRYPEYATTRALDRLRATEYARLDQAGHIYLDYTGGGLYADSQLRAHMAMLAGGTFGNPHSTNPTSQAMTERVEGARRFILEHFNADPNEYVCIFTLNASGALKLVGESYPFAPGGRFLLTFDNHNSVNGIREFARAKGATVTYTPVIPPDLRIDADKLTAHIQSPNSQVHNLFAIPAQSKFSGVKHSLESIARAQVRG
ncbi:MAG: aminotransferase class V-fold PLP-dependent enzyme, partial [Anaerolineales bacterium]